MVRFKCDEADPVCHEHRFYVAICDSGMGTIFDAHHRLGTAEQCESKDAGADQPGKRRGFERGDIDPSINDAIIAAVLPAPPPPKPAF